MFLVKTDFWNLVCVCVMNGYHGVVDRGVF